MEEDDAAFGGTSMELQVTQQTQQPVAVALPETSVSSDPSANTSCDDVEFGLQRSSIIENGEPIKDPLSAVQKGKQIITRPDGDFKKPLSLLDLPVDILKDIVKEVCSPFASTT
jgi:hypothetical protein